jgi:hypothetical protein
MASVLSGPFTVRAGGAIGGSAAGGRAIPSQPRRLSEAEQRHMAVRLRRDGWSYQRIAQTLDMRYSLVATIADGARDAGPAAGATDRRVSAPSTGVRRPAPGEEDGDMARKLDGLIAAVARQGEAIARLETAVPRAIEAAHDTLFERLVLSFKSMLDRLLPPAAAAPAPDPAPPAAGTPSEPA